MTDTFLDQNTTINLARDLRTIHTLLPEVLRIAHRESSPPGGRAARRPTVPSSTPPLNLGALHVHDDIAVILAGWSRNLADDAGITPPPDADPAHLAQHLERNTHEISQQAWAADCVAEVRRCRNQVKFMVDPPDAKYLGPCQAVGKPQCRGLFSGDGRDGFCERCECSFDVDAVREATRERMESSIREQNGTPMELSQLLRQAGIKVSNKQINAWASRKLISSRGVANVNGKTCTLYNLGEVELVAKRMEATRAAR